MFQWLKNIFARRPLVDRDWIQDSLLPFTPDIALLELREKHLIFVVDSLMIDREAHNLLINAAAEFMGRAYTQIEYVYYEVSHDNSISHVPMKVASTDSAAIKRKIFGHLFLVDNPTLRLLDIRYQNGVEYTRKRVNVIRPFFKIIRYVAPEGTELPIQLQGERRSPEYIHINKAWMYLGNREHWDSFEYYRFKPIKIVPYTGINDRSKWLKEFYYFPKSR